MGCTSSKLDDLPAVALCRDRCSFLEAAIQQRYLLSESHVAYTNSLRGIGHSLHLFINHHHLFVSSGGANGGGADSPRLNLPPQRKGDPEEEEEKSPPKKAKLPHAHAHAHAHSGSGSDSGHLEFDSDSDSEDEDDGEGGHLDLDSDSLHHLSPQHHHHLGHFPIQESIPYMDQQQQPGYNNTRYPNPEMMMGHHLPPPSAYSGGSYMHMNYMKNKSQPPSVIYEQRPSSPQRVYMGESSSSSSYNPYNPYPSNFGYSNTGPGPGYYGSSSGTTTSKPPPPPPSPPRSNGWDFLNPFDTYYPPYTPSRDSRELREEEGIPELEEDDSQYEVVKEVHGRPKFADQPPPVVYREEPPSPSSLPPVADKSGASTSGGGGGDAADASMYQSRPSVSVEKKVHVVEKTVVEDAGNEERRSSATGTRGGGGGGGGPRAVHEVAKEIENQFVKAAESASEIAKLLEVGKTPYGRKHASKLLHPSLPSSTSGGGSSAPAAATAPPTYADIEEELASRSRNLSSTLHKLHLWEKKLYHEVKAEEKLRVAHEKKLRKLKRLDERGAEATKVDTTRKLVRDMSTKIRIAIQVVDKISVTINKIRDEDLWPQLNALIQGLTRMWKTMLECHQNQCQAIREARGLGPIRASKKLGEEHLEATSLLGHELINWILGFSSWVSAQKGYVRELNKWLMKCLLYEPEETPDGIAPFSPGRMGAPPIFVICNQWSQALDRISEKEVIEAMRSFTTSVLQLWEQDRLETTMMGHGDSEKRVRNMDREEQKIHREIQALEKKMVLVAPGDGTNSLSLSGNVVYQSDTSNDSLQGSLQRIFEAMERFTAESVRAYDDLLVRAEEETAPRELEDDDEE